MGLNKIEREVEEAMAYGCEIDDDLPYHSKGMETYVYFVLAIGANKVKIGRSDNVGKRIVGLQVGCPNKLILLKSYKAGWREENFLHMLFEEDNVHGEWFNHSDKMKDFLKYIGRGGEVRSREYFDKLDKRTL